MPEYDFRCTECDEMFEVSRPMGSTAKECCPSCGAAAKRVFTPVGVAFKGSGFHNTDYRPKAGDEQQQRMPGEGAGIGCVLVVSRRGVAILAAFCGLANERPKAPRCGAFVRSACRVRRGRTRGW